MRVIVPVENFLRNLPLLSIAVAVAVAVAKLVFRLCHQRFVVRLYIRQGGAIQHSFWRCHSAYLCFPAEEIGLVE